MDGFSYISRFSSRFGWTKQRGFTSALSFGYSKKNRPTKSCGLGFTRPRCRGKIDDVTTQGNQILKEMAHEKNKKPSLKLTVRTWKLMVGRWSFPFGARPSFRGYVSSLTTEFTWNSILKRQSCGHPKKRNAFVFLEKSPRVLSWNGPCHSADVSFARLKQLVL